MIQALPTFQRLSIDGILADRYGICGIDYPGSDYDKYQDEADTIFRQSAERILSEGKQDLVLDRSFWAKDDRDFFKELVERYGGRWVLVHLKLPKDILWQRVCSRREAGVDADSALEISEELMEFYFKCFEIPVGEGEVVVERVA